MLRTFILILQIGIILCALLISVVRLGAPYLTGYEAELESWFNQQGIEADISHIALNVDNLSPEITINGVTIYDLDHNKLLTLKRATLHIDAWQSLVKQQLIINNADFYLDKIALNTALLLQTESNAELDILSPELTNSLIGLNQFSIMVEKLDLTDSSQHVFSLYDSTIKIAGIGKQKKIILSSALMPTKKSLLSAQLDVDLSQLQTQKKLMGSGFMSLSIDSLSELNLLKKLSLKGLVSINNWFEFDGLNGSLLSQINAQKVQFNLAKKVHELDFNNVTTVNYKNGLIDITSNSKKLLFNKVDLKHVKINAQSELKEGELNQVMLLVENLAVTEVKKIAASLPQLKTINSYSQSLKPQGLIKQVFVKIPSLKNIADSQIALDLKNVQWRSYQGIPAVNKVSLNVVANQKKLNAQVSSKNLSVYLADQFTKPFSVDEMTATVNANLKGDDFLIDVPKVRVNHKASTIDARLNLFIQKDASPYMYLRLKARNANIETVTPFLPQILMGKDVLNWVTSSVRQATVKTAEVLYAGRLENDVNFDVKNNGIFETVLNVEDVDLLYEKNWPSLQSKQIDVTFKNYQLKASSGLASTQGLKAKEIVFSINDLNEAKAHLSLNLNDELSKQWAFLKNSPIKNDIPYFFDVTNLKGYVTTKVEANFPLINDVPVEAQFNVILKAHKVGFFIKKLGVQLSDLKGDVKITQDGISIKPTTAKWYGQPITLSVKNDKGSTFLKMHGDQIDVASLLKKLPDETLKHVSGKSAWEVNVAIHKPSSDKPVVSIEAHSGLKGTSVYLPPPFLLAKDETRYFKVNVDINKSEDVNVNLFLDKQLDAKLKLLKQEDDSYLLTSGNIQFGNEAVAKKVKVLNGFHIAGKVNELNLDHWLAYLTSEEPGDKVLYNDRYLSLIESINLSVEQLHIKNIQANKVKLVITKSEKGLVGNIQSSVAEGRFFIPVLQPIEMPIEIDFDRFEIVLKEGLGNSDKNIYKTDDLPSLIFNSKKFSISGRNFSDVHVEIESHRRNEFLLKSLILNHQKIKVKASGTWLFNEALQQNVSHLKIAVNGDDFGQTLAQLGFGKSFDDGSVAFSGNLTWPDSFWALDFDEAKGTATIKIKEGYLLDVDPAEGRFVGLLSLSALPRRLTLDFSDFFKEGLEFDRITGDFSIHDGSMWTTNLSMTGSVSDVNIVGRTGLKEKDYDQIITIIPQVRDALPVLGSLVAGSTVGWAMLLFQRLFKDPIDDSVSIKYKVTGHWDSPKIDLIEKPKPNVTDDNSEL